MRILELKFCQSYSYFVIGYEDMSLATFRRQIENLQTSTTDVPVNTLFQDLVESLQHNKDIKKYRNIGKHILTTLISVEKQKLKEIIDCLEVRYQRKWKSW